MTLLRPSPLPRSVEYLYPTDLLDDGGSFLRVLLVNSATTFWVAHHCGERAFTPSWRGFPLTYILIITHFLGFVKRFFEKNLDFFGGDDEARTRIPLAVSICQGSFNAPLWQVQRLCTHNALPFVLHPRFVSLL